MTEDAASESLAEFKTSFSYGSRNDLSFKFLKSLSEEEVGEFFRSLLEKLGDSYDDGDIDRLIEHAYEWQVRGYAPRPGAPRKFVYDDGPFAPLVRPLAQSRVALLTSSGHFVDGHDPEPFGVADMSQDDAVARISEFMRAEPELSAIPVDTPPERLRVRHGGYDVRSAAKDHNVSLPIDRLREAAASGRIGAASPTAYSFVGACSQLWIRKKSGPEWAARLRDEAVDAVVMVPV